MDLRKRVVACAVAAAAGLAAAGVLALPASAGGEAATTAGNAADLSIEASAGTIAAGAPSKFAKINVNNNSRHDAKNILVTFDLRALDQSKVRFDLSGAHGENGPVCGKPDHAVISCRSNQLVLPAGIQWGWFFGLVPAAGASGSAGHIKATISYDGKDPRPSDNSAILPVRVGGNGPDMFLVADDAEQVFSVDDQGVLNWGGPVAPGQVSDALYMIVNSGDAATTGMRVTITLPKGTSFANHGGPRAVGCGSGAGTCAPSHCDYRRDNRSVVCVYDNFPLIPISQDTDSTDKVISKQGFFHEIKIDDSLPGQQGLISGGSVRVEPLGPAAAPARDVDTTDDGDGFRVIVS